MMVCGVISTNENVRVYTTEIYGSLGVEKHSVSICMYMNAYILLYICYSLSARNTIRAYYKHTRFALERAVNKLILICTGRLGVKKVDLCT